jgi:hypothetical protein
MHEVGDLLSFDSVCPRSVAQAGVSIAVPGEWHVDSVASALIGNETAEALLFRASEAVLLSDGRIVIANAGTREIRMHDRDGHLLWSRGGEGDGPGEFRALSDLWSIRGDTLVAWDFEVSRLSWFASDGSHAGSHSWRLSVDTVGDVRLPRSLDFLGVLDDGTVVARHNPFNLARQREQSRAEGRYQDPQEIFMFDRWQHPIRTVIFPGNEYVVLVVEHNGTPTSTSGDIRWGRRFIAAVRGDMIAVGDGRMYRICVYDSTGIVQLTVDRMLEPTAATSADIGKYWEERRRGQADIVSRRSDYASMVGGDPEAQEGPPFSETLPAFAGMRLDRAGNLWVEEHWISRYDAHIWSVFDSTGAWVGRLTVPESWEVLDVAPDYLLVRTRDELRVERIGLHRIRRS